MGKAKNCCECGWDLESYPFRKITTGCESEVWSCSGWEMQIRLTDVGRWRVMSSEWLPTSPVIPQDMMTTCTPWTLALVPCSTVFRSIQCDPLIEITSLTFSLLCPCASLQLFFGCFLPFFLFFLASFWPACYPLEWRKHLQRHAFEICIPQTVNAWIFLVCWFGWKDTIFVEGFVPLLFVCSLR